MSLWKINRYCKHMFLCLKLMFVIGLESKKTSCYIEPFLNGDKVPADN